MSKKTKHTGYIPITPAGHRCYSCGDDMASGAKKKMEIRMQCTWGKLLTEGWRVVKFEGRKGAK